MIFYPGNVYGFGYTIKDYRYGYSEPVSTDNLSVAIFNRTCTASGSLQLLFLHHGTVQLQTPSPPCVPLHPDAGLGLKTDANGGRNTYPIFTFTFFSRTEMKTGMPETKIKHRSNIITSIFPGQALLVIN
jgi:hypothetical protein